MSIKELFKDYKTSRLTFDTIDCTENSFLLEDFLYTFIIPKLEELGFTDIETYTFNPSNLIESEYTCIYNGIKLNLIIRIGTRDWSKNLVDRVIITVLINDYDIGYFNFFVVVVEGIPICNKELLEKNKKEIESLLVVDENKLENVIDNIKRYNSAISFYDLILNNIQEDYPNTTFKLYKNYGKFTIKVNKYLKVNLYLSIDKPIKSEFIFNESFHPTEDYQNILEDMEKIYDVIQSIKESYI